MHNKSIKITDIATWKNLVWNLVKEQPIRKSSSCLASTESDSFLLGSTRAVGTSELKI